MLPANRGDEPDGVASELDPLALLEAAPDGTVVVDANGDIVFVNQQIERMLGFPRAQLLGRSVDVLVPDAARVGHAGLRQGYAHQPQARAMGMAAQLRAACADGRSIPVEISLSPVAMGSEVYVIAAVRDVADREMAHEELRAARARLAVADDRDRIARDLHDTVIQRVFASALTLQAISRSVEDPARSRVLGVVDDLDMTIRQLRAAVFDLKQPGHADDVIGLLAPVIDDAARVLGFAPRVVVEGVSSFVPAIVAGELSAVLREALSNIMRHASASEVDIELVLSSALVRLTVSDDGVGISARSRGGSGLANMQARAAALAGSFAATRRPDRGSRVVWEVPITAAMVASSSVP